MHLVAVAGVAAVAVVVVVAVVAVVVVVVRKAVAEMAAWQRGLGQKWI